jgi:hypothetical protein
MTAVEKIFRWVGRGSASEERAVTIEFGYGICEEPMVTFTANGASFSYPLGGVEKALAGRQRERSELARGLRALLIAVPTDPRR